MDVLYERCCGLDVHKKTVTACAITPADRQWRTFATVTKGLLELADWLKEQGVTHVAMESTGVYWKPVYNILEGEFSLLLVNAQHIKAVPGRKTDMRDAEWIAELLQHGLLRASFVPEREQRELREATRYRRTLIQERSRVVNRIHKTLEGGNVKLASVASDVLGASGLAMLQALVAGETDAQALAELAKGRLKDKRAALEEALQGRIGAHQRLMLASHIRHLEFLNQEIEHWDEEVAQRMHPFETEVQRLDEVPGVGCRGAEELLAEIGTDMERFPSAEALASWARICPGTQESAGKRGSGRTGHGNRWVRSTLIEVAWAAVRSRNTYLAAQYHRLAARRGAKRAIVAVAHSILTIIYHLLRDGSDYQDLGGNYFEQRQAQAIVQRAVRRIEKLGYQVILQPA